MSLSDRLRGIVRPVNGPPKGGPHEGLAFQRIDTIARAGRLEPARSDDDVAETLGGEWREERGQRYLVVDRKYGPGHRHGRVTIADAMPGGDDAWPRLSLLARTPVSGRLLFFDLETTGLAGGAGTYAFLVGCGWFDGPAFRVRQFFLSAFTAEAAMLAGVDAFAGEAAALVTYNGKSFDLPLIENRYVLHRARTALTALPHIDMLHPARRFWRDPWAGTARPGQGATDDREESSCRLTSLERTQCGFEREGDVPGFEIPSRYFAYVRSGNARPLAAVLEHNRLDLVSLAMLTARTANMLEEGPSAARSGREAYGLGCIYQHAGLIDDARECYVVAAGPLSADAATTGEALRALALICRSERKFDDAAGAWQRVLQLQGCPASLAREATEALAVHHEHRLRDLTSAHTYAAQMLCGEVRPSRRKAAMHRLARLERKLGLLSTAEAPSA